MVDPVKLKEWVSYSHAWGPIIVVEVGLDDGGRPIAVAFENPVPALIEALVEERAERIHMEETASGLAGPLWDQLSADYQDLYRSCARRELGLEE